MRRWLRAVLAIAGALSALACMGPAHPRRVEALQRALPELAARQILAWRGQDWCQAIQHPGGAFAAPADRGTCTFVLGDATPAPLTPAAHDELEAVREALGGGVMWLTIEYEGAAIRRAVFSLDCLRCGRDALIYEPGYGALEAIPGERWFERIDGDWYLRREDWN